MPEPKEELRNCFPLAQRRSAGPDLFSCHWMREAFLPDRPRQTLWLKWMKGWFQQTPQRSLVRGCNRNVHKSACADLRREPLRSTGGLAAKPRKQAHPAADGADAYIIFTGPSSHTFLSRDEEDGWWVGTSCVEFGCVARWQCRLFTLQSRRAHGHLSRRRRIDVQLHAQPRPPDRSSRRSGWETPDVNWTNLNGASALPKRRSPLSFKSRTFVRCCFSVCGGKTHTNTKLSFKWELVALFVTISLFWKVPGIKMRHDDSLWKRNSKWLAWEWCK